MLHMGLKRVLQVVAHELAHAIVGYGHGHDAVWRAKAIELGDTGARCGESMEVAPTVLGEHHCGFQVKRFRKVTGGMCPKCRHLPHHQRILEWSRV
jgi:hypothetical protein